MERETEATTSKGLYGGERGAGGKFRKPPLRKPPTTPYQRPPPQTQRQTSDGGGGGWLSKLVNPATRLISGGATRLLPSFVSKSLFGSVTDHSDNTSSAEANQDVDDEIVEHESNIQISQSAGGQGPVEAERTEVGSDIDEHVEDKSSDSSSFSEIEQMLKGITFSRHDLNRLTELLHSRIADPSDIEERSKTNPNMTTGAEATGGSLEEKPEAYSERVTGQHLQSSIVRDQVGASPIDIAKAYMGSRTSESGLGSQTAIFRDERTPLPTHGFSSNLSISSPSPKSSICWPGATVQDQHPYQTPQTQRGRIGLHNLPRTPYSRPAHTRSTSKLQDGGNRSVHISPWKTSPTAKVRYVGNSSVRISPWKTSPVPEVTRKSPPDDDFGSVGPVRRTRHKFVETTPFRTRLYSKPPSSSVGLSTTTGQEMFKQLNRSLRTIPPVLEETVEKYLANERRNSSSEVTTGTMNEKLNEQHIEGSHLHRSGVTTQQFSAKGKEVAGSSILKPQPDLRKFDEATDAVKANSSVTNTVSSVNGFGCDGVGFNARPSTGFKKTQHSQVNAHEVTGRRGDNAQSEKNQTLPLHNHVDKSKDLRLFSKDAGSEVLNVQRKPPAHAFGSKPALASISISKPDPKRIVSFDNGSGFTFPVSASSGTTSEPSTPSVMPFSSASGLPRPQEKPTPPTNNFGSNAAEPSYSFGSKKTGGALVFSFPSTSSSTPGDGSSPKFNIGSDRKARLSFSTAVDAADAGLKRGRLLQN